MATLATIRGEVRRLLADLNAHAQAHADGDGATKGFPLPDENIVGPETLASVTLAATAQTITDLSSPSFYSTLYVQGNASGIVGDVVIAGTNWRGEVVTDTIALSGTDAVSGVTAFKEVASAIMPVETHAGTDVVYIKVDHSVSCTVDTVSVLEGDATYPWVMDFDSGRVDFTSAAPPAGTKNVVWSYQYTYFNNDDVLSAINNAIADIWAEIGTTKLDTTTITADSTVYDYALPADCSRLVRVDKRSSTTSPYLKENNWRVVPDGATRYLYLYAPSTGYTYRLHYVAEPLTMADDTDTLADVSLPARAKWALIYMSCFYLVQGKLLPRIRTNQFKNAEGTNVPKIYEIQRVSADFRTLAELEMRKVRKGVQRWGV